METLILQLHESGQGMEPGVIPGAANLQGNPVPPAWPRDTLCTATLPPPVSIIPVYPEGPWPCSRPERARGLGAEPGRWQGPAPMVSKPDGPSKVAIKIPSNFLTPGQHAEQAYFLHTLVTCLLPRAEVIQKTPGDHPAPPSGKPACSGRLPRQAAEGGYPASCRKVGASWTCEREGSSLQLHLSSCLRQGGAQRGGSNPFSHRCSWVGGIGLEGLLSVSHPK